MLYVIYFNYAGQTQLKTLTTGFDAYHKSDAVSITGARH